ncbi:uncharacterized protein LTR77_001102 [Saxophila tyrrhenica]|uniref:Transcription initiation factor IIE subunit beta n=1 Tax=Saxophila tyrrhenica TaxID=1690608 RepID=A0AAV9PNY1_9PEZI|nr:hypothetical protein LTR77_001102 [Saxophila tyrrhenica]
MALNASLAKFRTEFSDATARNVQHARPTNAPARTTTPKPSDGIAKRTHDAAFSDTKAGTPAAAAALATRHSGAELMTQVYTAVQYLKEKSPAPIAFDNLISYLSLPTDAQKHIPLIRRALRDSDQATYVPRAESPNGKESFKYRPQIPVTNAEELKDYLGIMATRSASGIAVKDLKDGWPDCTASLDQLEREGFVLITRWKKDNSPRTIYPDSPSYHILNSHTGLPQKIDADFVDVWSKTKLPAGEAEIRNELEKAGLTPTSQVKEVRKTEPKRKEKRRVNRKGGKTTNAHMLGILKDYSKK